MNWTVKQPGIIALEGTDFTISVEIIDGRHYFVPKYGTLPYIDGRSVALESAKRFVARRPSELQEMGLA